MRPEALAGRPPAISIVVPVRNEVQNIAPLLEEIRRSLDGRFDYELIYVDDGSDDGTWQRLAEVACATPQLRRIRHRAGYGQSAALRTGIAAAHGDAIVTLDGDGQNDPADIPRLLQILRAGREKGPLLVVGHRRDRRASRVRSTRAFRRPVGSGTAYASRCSYWLIPDGRKSLRHIPYTTRSGQSSGRKRRTTFKMSSLW